MYSKKDIIKNLNEYNYFIEDSILDNFIKNWKIDPIYEDEDGIEFFDNLSIVKIKKGISLKTQGFDNDQIVYHLNKILVEKVEDKAEEKPETKIPEMVPVEVQPAPVVAQNQASEVKNFTVDVTGQTLQMLAEAVAQKISSEIKEQIKESFSPQFLATEELEKNNQELAQQVEELLNDNKKLAQRVDQLEKFKAPLAYCLKKIYKFFS